MSSYAIGVDLGGTNLRIAAYTRAAGILEIIHLQTRVDTGPRAVVRDMADGIQTLITRHAVQGELTGIGVGAPGPLELPAGRLHSPPNLPGWSGFELRVEMEAAFKRRVFVERDANLAALAECLLGSGHTLGIDSRCMLTLGTGVGGGIIENSHVWHGANGMGGEAGHINIYPDGPQCGCGNHGCLEVYASGTALRRIAYEWIAAGTAPELAAKLERSPEFTTRDLATWAKAGNPDALRIFDHAGCALGIGLATLVNTLNLPLYVVGGGVAQSWELLSPALFEEIRRRSYVYRLTAQGGAASNPNRGTLIVPAELGIDSGILGACLLPSSPVKEALQ